MRPMGQLIRLLCLFIVILGYGSGNVHATDTTYRIGPNDQLRIQVFGEEDLTVENKIDGNGNLTFPLLGMLHLAGKTIQEVQEELSSRLAAGYVRSPKVTAYVVRYRNFFVTGQVRSPGGYPYEEGLTVQKAISLAGGQTERAERGAISVLRRLNGREESIVVKLGAQVLPDDVIVVAEGQKFFISGEVQKPNSYPFEEGLTVGKALALAGGRTERSPSGPLKLTRVTKGVAATTIVSSEAVVFPDDILVIEQEQRKFFVSGEVRTPGGYLYQEAVSVNRALAMAGGLTEKADRGALHILRRVNEKEEKIPIQLESTVLPNDILVAGEGQRVYVSGEVKSPGRFLYEQGLTVQKSISFAGGRTEKGDKGEIKITRLANGLAETLSAAPDAVVLPDDIIVVDPENHKFYVSGEVRTPGSYPYQDGLTVHRAVATAGGLTEKAERGELRVLRRVNNIEETIAVQLDTVILPDDIVVVAEGRKIFVSGEVKTPGRYLYEKGLTIEKAVGIAGGRNEKAEKITVKLTRVKDGVAQSLDVDTDLVVEPNDVIVVPELKKVYVDGEVKRAGDYPFQRGLTVHKAITMAGGVTDKASLSSTKILRKVNGREESIPVTLDGTLQPEDIIVVPRSFF